MPKTLDVKRKEADERHEAYRKLTPEDRLARLESARGESKRERARLLGLIEKRTKTKKKGKKDAANTDAV